MCVFDTALHQQSVLFQGNIRQAHHLAERIHLPHRSFHCFLAISRRQPPDLSFNVNLITERLVTSLLLAA